MIEATTLIRLPEVIKRVGLSKSSLYAAITARRFPAPVKIGPNTSAWEQERVENFIQQRIAISADAAKSSQARAVKAAAARKPGWNRGRGKTRARAVSVGGKGVN